VVRIDYGHKGARLSSGEKNEPAASLSLSSMMVERRREAGDRSGVLSPIGPRQCAGEAIAVEGARGQRGKPGDEEGDEGVREREGERATDGARARDRRGRRRSSSSEAEEQEQRKRRSRRRQR